MTSSEYSRAGSANPLTEADINPVEQCVGDSYFTKSGVPGANMQLDFCPRFMSQRCSINWDAYCDSYLFNNKVDQGGFSHLDKNFLTEVAKKKYCRLDTGAPGGHCSTRCESFLPENSTSVQICESIGTQNWLNTKEEYDLGGNFPQSARLNPLSPLFLGHCPETCDAKNPMPPDGLTASDPVLNKCIEYGTCENVLLDLAYNVVKNNIPVSNPAFQQIINFAKLDKPINPNVAAKIAINYGIPPDVALQVLKSASDGGISNVPQPAAIAAITNMMSPTPSTAVQERPGIVMAPSREGFYPPKQAVSSNTWYIISGVCGALALLALIYLIYMKMK